MKKIWDVIKDLFSNTFNLTVVRNSNKGSHIVSQNITINNQEGYFAPNITIVEAKEKMSPEESINQVAKSLHENHKIDVNNIKFKYYANLCILILNLNDSSTKREVLKKLLYKKFSGEEQAIDDTDAPTTIALDAMKYLTDVTLRRLCVFRLLTNVLPSIINDNIQTSLSLIISFIKQNGLLDHSEIMNLRRLGIIHDMNMNAYSIDIIRDYISSEMPVANLDDSEESLILSSCLSPAGIEITNITLGYFLGLRGLYESWLPVKKKSLHLRELIVDEDVTVNKNIVAYGTVASGGRATPSEAQ